jgi:rhodanese-related sulfurtransferase
MIPKKVQKCNFVTVLIRKPRYDLNIEIRRIQKMWGIFTRPGHIKAKDANEMLSQGRAILVDVRTPQEYATGHIGGAKLLPLNALASKAQKTLPDKDSDVIVYCQSGARSAQAAAMLGSMGYKNVHDLGGIYSWPYGITQ